MTPVLVFLLLVVIGTGALVGAMFLTNSAMGGVYYGSVPVVVAKSAGLVIAVQLCHLWGVAGLFLAIPIWWLGLMLLFKISFWDCWMLVLINWFVNGLAWLLIHGLMWMQQGGIDRGIPT